MPLNIEIKARVADMDSFEKVVHSLSDSPCEVLEQEDTFFNVLRGRLKLRMFADEAGHLIFYERSNTKTSKSSQYLIYETDNAEALCQVLAMALDSPVKVKKIRHLYRYGQTRIHLDRVEGLGTFMELEVVLREDQAVEEGHEIANQLMQKLNIGESQLVAGAYADLIQQRA